MKKKDCAPQVFVARRNGVTFVELTIYLAILAILIGMVAGVFFWLRKTSDNTQRLDSLVALRGPMLQLSHDLSFGTDIVYPSERRLNTTCHQLVFTDQINDLIAIYLDNSGQLCRLNMREYEKDPAKGLTILSKHVVEFRVIRKDIKYVEYSLSVNEKGENTTSGLEYTFTNSARLKNHLN